MINHHMIKYHQTIQVNNCLHDWLSSD